MTNENKYIEGKPFYYQIGEVTTLIPWWRPSYDRLCKFFQQEEVIEIFKKYKYVEIIGNCLWDFDVTWDMDLRLIISHQEYRNGNKKWYWFSIYHFATTITIELNLVKKG